MNENLKIDLRIYIYSFNSSCKLSVTWEVRGKNETLVKKTEEIIIDNEKKYGEIVKKDEKLISRYLCKPFCENCDPVICQFTLYPDMSDEAISEVIEKQFIRFMEIKKL